MHVVVAETNLTFDRRGREISEEADGHFQNVSFLQLGVACVVFANQRKNQAFQVTETVVDTSTSSLLQQGFESLGEKSDEKTLISCTLEESNQKTFQSGINSCSFCQFPSLTFLSSLACFLWATVDLAVRGWLASVVMLGLMSFAACCCAFWKGGTCSWSG